jgi:hypothetical protein
MANKCDKCGGIATASGFKFCVICHKRVCGYCVWGSERGAVCGEECREKACKNAEPSKPLGTLAVLLLAVLFAVPRIDAQTPHRFFTKTTAAEGIAQAKDHAKPQQHWLIKAAITARMADIVTTKIALGRPNTYEANPLFGRRPRMERMILTEAALGVATWGMAKGLTELGHPGIARGLLIGSTIAEGAVSIHNATVHGKP